MVKRLSSLALLLAALCLAATAQELGTWRMYLSYQIATKSEVSGSIIYSLMNGNLLSYDTEDGEVRTYDHTNALNDVNIAHIAYCKEAKKLLIVYSNTNIDLLSDDGNVQNLSALKDKRILDKDVTDVFIKGSMAYLATGFGFVELDMKEGVFRNTYRLGFAVTCIAVSDNAVFLGTADGMKRCMLTANMQLEENWKLINGWPNIKSMRIYQGNVMVARTDALFAYNPTTNKSTNIASGYFTVLKDTGSQLVWANKTKIGFASDVSSPDNATIIPYDNQWSDISYLGGKYWMSEQENGLRGYKIEGNDIVATGEVIQPSSPIRDIAYNLSWVGDRLLVAGGINTIGSFFNPATAMYYEDGQWTNFKEMEVAAPYTNIKLRNTTDLVQDPLDDTHHFASLYRNGLCEYRNAQFVKLYNHDNSPLHSLIPTLPLYYNYVMCAALSYDLDGSLWMASSLMDTTLHVLKPDGKWLNLYYEELAGASLIDKILHHSSGIKLVTSRRVEKRGVFCLDTKGTDRTTDDRTILHQNIYNQDGTPYLPEMFYCLCEDLDGLVWVGTSAGLFVIEDVTKVFDKDFQFTQIKINRNDGSGLADYLLNDVSIACIAVDAANRKWIGTQTNGALLISADGQEMLQHFTTEDSPLLSDNVQSIAVHPGTGEVVFGTDKGICSYMSEASAPEEELKKSNVTIYPNPVTPDYNGPIAIRGLVADTEVKIISTGGQLVWNGRSAGGTCIWDGVANNGRRVASGIYHVVANTPEGGKAIISRIVIVR